MFATLLESRAPRTRRTGGTALSLLAHGALIAGAVGLTATSTSGATDAPKPPRPDLTYVITPPPAPSPAPPSASTSSATQAPAPRRVVIDIDGVVPPTLPPIDLGGPRIDAADVVIGHGGASVPSTPGATGGHGLAGEIVNEREVDRAPGVIGAAPTPRYPEALRGAGITGRVVVQFVVDTLGRAEPGLEVIEAARPEFVDAVRAVLPRYRFTAGEAAGRKVRTRVQVPFDFTLR